MSKEKIVWYTEFMYWWSQHPFLYLFTCLVNVLGVFLCVFSLGVTEASYWISVVFTILLWSAFFAYTKIFSFEFFLVAIPVACIMAILFPDVTYADRQVYGFLLLVVAAIGIVVYRYHKGFPKR